MTNLRPKGEIAAKLQVNMKDLEIGVPFKNGFLKADILNKPRAIHFEGQYF